MTPFPDRLARALAQRDPTLLDDTTAERRPASVAMITAAQAGGPGELLLIQRAHRPGDPWSGHLAFPGGRIDPEDPSPRAAAERETREEVGLDLSANARFLGRLDDLGGAGHPVVVSGFAYALQRRPDDLELEQGEVADAFWVPVDRILDPTRWKQHAFTWRGVQRSLPAVDLLGPGRPVLWGLTYRFICDVMHMLGHDELPRAW